MVEYGVVSHVLLIGSAGTMLVMFRLFMNALSSYFEGIYAVLASPTI